MTTETIAISKSRQRAERAKEILEEIQSLMKELFALENQKVAFMLRPPHKLVDFVVKSDEFTKAIKVTFDMYGPDLEKDPEGIEKHLWDHAIDGTEYSPRSS